MKNSLCKTVHDYTIPKTKIAGGLNTKLHTKAVSLAFENIHELSFFFDNDKVTSEGTGTRNTREPTHI